MARRLSVIVVALNEAGTVPDLGAALRGLPRPPDLEVEAILVDGGSDDGTPEAARRAGFDRVLSLPGANIPACRNRGLREASGEWLAFLDADCIPAAGWLEQAVRLLEREPCALFGWPAGPPDPPTWVQAAWHTHWLARLDEPSDEYDLRLVRRGAWRALTTRNLVLHRAAVDRAGPFDESLAAGEDTEFVRRAAARGVTLFGAPDLRVTHRGEPATLGAFFAQQRWHAHRGACAAIEREAGAGATLRVTAFGLTFTLAFLAFLVGPLVIFVWPDFRAALLVAGLPLVLAAPAAYVCLRRRSPRWFLPLLPLYFAYGLARMLALAGLNAETTGWKRAKV